MNICLSDIYALKDIRRQYFNYAFKKNKIRDSESDDGWMDGMIVKEVGSFIPYP